MTAFRWPVRTYDVVIKLLDELINRSALDMEDAIRPDSQNARRLQHASHFAVERVQVEPVQRLGNRYKIERARLNSTLLCWCHAICHVGMGCRRTHLLLTRVRGDNRVEPLRKGEGCLTGAARAIPNCMSLRAAMSQVVEK